MTFSPRLLGSAFLIVAACSSPPPVADNRPPPPPPPAAPRAVVHLTAESVAAFVAYAEASTEADTANIRAELARASNDPAVAEAFAAELLRDWSISADGQQVLADVWRADFVLSLIKGLRSPYASADIHARIWWALPSTNEVGEPGGFPPKPLAEVLESDAVEVLACSPGDATVGWVREIAQSHPDPSVRMAAVNALKHPYCLFGQDVAHP
jgi:hypothetical protein